jgi:hypothetical protein
VLCLIALVVVLVIWALGQGGSGGGKGSSAPSDSHTPVSTITPGPTPTGTHIGGRPGGRDTAPSDGGSSAGSSDGSTSGSTAGSSAGSAGSSSGTTNGSTDAGSSAGGGQDGGTDGASAGVGGAGGVGGPGGTGSSSSTGGPVAAGSTLPDCTAGSVQLALTSVQNAYSPGQTPAFKLSATNSGAVSCKVDFAPAKAVFTITAAAGDDHVWASDDCPTPGQNSYLLQIPAHGTTTFTLHWTGKTSSPQCATPKGAQAGPGTYLVSAQLPGYPAKQASFVLSKD